MLFFNDDVCSDFRDQTEAGSDVKISKTKEKNNKMDIWGVESEDELEEVPLAHLTAFLDRVFLLMVSLPADCEGEPDAR